VEAFTTHTGTAVPLRRSSVDTDQIIPAEYLKRITRTGFHDGLFAAWKADPEFTLNRVEHRGASILVAGSDFGTGSSREHAVWALLDGGFRVVVSSRFGDIFCSNAGKSGLLTAQVHSDAVEELWRRVEEEPSTLVTVDLNKRQISTPLGFRASFEIDDYTSKASMTWTSPCRKRTRSPRTRTRGRHGTHGHCQHKLAKSACGDCHGSLNSLRCKEVGRGLDNVHEREASEQVRVHRQARHQLQRQPTCRRTGTRRGDESHHPRGRTWGEGRHHRFRCVREGDPPGPHGP
jgi:3-isopropylmalate/(R)-2-methylmalate dehydratase small subunit